MSNLLKKEKGFTLIEIVLVLAIAGLLLVVVFLAVSGAQKSRRDSQRKNDASAFAANLETLAGNANGVYPASTAAAQVGFTRTDPSGANYNVVAAVAAVVPPSGTIAYGTSMTCNGATAVGGANARTYAVVVGLEQGGSACFTNK